MNKKTMATLMALSMLAMAFAFAPSATAIPCQEDTDGDGKKDTGDKDDCDAHVQIAGPAGIIYKNQFGGGYGTCFNIDPTLAFNCGNTYAPSGIGMYRHNTTTDCVGFTNCVFNVWVRQSDGTGNDGFAVAVGNDRDDDGFASNVGSGNDHFAVGYTGDVLAGESKDDYKDGYAHVTFCVQQDLDSSYDDFMITIMAWVDESIIFGDNNIGVGVGLGVYDVWVDHKYNNDPNCPGGPYPPMFH